MQALRLNLVTLFIILALCDTGRGELHVGGGAKAGEITESTAVVHVRVTSAEGQDAQGLIAGHAGEARVLFDVDEGFGNPRTTSWEAARPEEDHSIQFRLDKLLPARRWYYRVELRERDGGPVSVSAVYSFVTAPDPKDRARVHFHVTTCQDTRAESTYLPMAAQKPDFCVSAGDTVYYDGEGGGRTVAEAWQAYQKMFGLPAMKQYYQHVGGYFLKDDHDYRFNDADPFMKGRWVAADQNLPGARYTEVRGNQKLDVAWLTHAEGLRVFRQVFPASDKPYRTFRWGHGVQIWLLENRDFRSPNELPDGSEKSIWGSVQKAWLKESLLASDADYQIIVSPNPIIGPDRLMKGDNQANLNGFWHEGQAFLDWLTEQKLDRVILMCGDRHWQYHSIDRRQGRAVHEFSVGPTCDEHTQAIPPEIKDVDRTYAASRGGFVGVTYEPDRTLTFQFYSVGGEPLHKHRFSYNGK